MELSEWLKASFAHRIDIMYHLREILIIVKHVLEFLQFIWRWKRFYSTEVEIDDMNLEIETVFYQVFCVKMKVMYVLHINARDYNFPKNWRMRYRQDYWEGGYDIFNK